MFPIAKSFLATLTAAALILAPALSPPAFAQASQAQPSQHVVSSADLQNAIAASVATRQAEQAKLVAFLSTPRARQALKKAGLDYEVVRQAIPLLSPRQLADLSARADKAQRQFRAGALTNLQITYIIIALATALIVILIFEA